MRRAARSLHVAVVGGGVVGVAGRSHRPAEAAAEAMVRAFHNQDARDDAARRNARAVLDQLAPVARRHSINDPAYLQRAARLDALGILAVSMPGPDEECIGEIGPVLPQLLVDQR